MNINSEKNANVCFLSFCLIMKICAHRSPGYRQKYFTLAQTIYTDNSEFRHYVKTATYVYELSQNDIKTYPALQEQLASDTSATWSFFISVTHNLCGASDFFDFCSMKL